MTYPDQSFPPDPRTETATEALSSRIAGLNERAQSLSSVLSRKAIEVLGDVPTAPAGSEAVKVGERPHNGAVDRLHGQLTLLERAISDIGVATERLGGL